MVGIQAVWLAVEITSPTLIDSSANEQKAAFSPTATLVRPENGDAGGFKPMGKNGDERRE
jgi:hypothetical protein